MDDRWRLPFMERLIARLRGRLRVPQELEDMATPRTKKFIADDRSEPPSTEQKRKYADENYEDLRSFYQGETVKYASWYTTLAVTTLVGASLTPLLLLIDFPEKSSWSKFVQAFPSAIGGLAAGLNAAFRYRQQWAQNYMTLSALMNESQRFRCRTSPEYDKDENLAIDRFQNRMSEITMAEVAGWKTGLLAEDVAKVKSSGS
jgi:hypothetical protein